MANGNKQALFAEDSDQESIKTDTTVEDYDSHREYDVECVLAEQSNGDTGQIYYLIKWEGYALFDCTWEPKEHITHDVVLRQWETEKRLVRQGQKKPFDVAEYNRVFEEHLEERERKKLIRKAKRRRKGIPVSSDEDEDEEDSSGSFDIPTTEAPKRTRTKVAPLAKRKGVALPVQKRRNTTSNATHVRPEIAAAPDDSDLDSLFEERDEVIPLPASPKSKKLKTAPPASSGRYALSAPKTTKSTAEKSTTDGLPATKTIQPAPSVQRKASISNIASRKSAPSGGVRAAKSAPKSKVFANWDKPKKQKSLPRVSSETSKDSTDPKFTHLSTLNRYHKYRHNEPAPNPEALVMIDPRTGKTLPAQAAPVWTGPGDIHSAYGRRAPPPTKKRTPSPVSPQRSRPSDAGFGADQSKTANLVSAVTQPFEPYGPNRRPKVQLTCKYWLDGHCRFPSDKCQYVHADIGPINSKKHITCHYWAERGRCNKRDEDCEFAHYWTDEIAGVPGTFNQRFAASSGMAQETIFGQMRISSPNEQIVTLFSPVEQPTSGATAQLPQAVVNEEASRPIPAETVTDPRLRGRAPRVSDVNTLPQEQYQQPIVVDRSEKAPPSPTLFTEDIEMTDEVDFSHGSSETDLEMARRDIGKVDATKLLSHSSSDKEILNVYIHMPGRPDELALLENYFRGLNRQVFTSNSAGAWKFFAKSYGSKECLLVVHPTETFTGSLPGLYNLLVGGGAGFRVFSIGVQHAQCIRESRKPAFEALRLFPHAGITFITDDVFVYYPDKATRIIEDFIEDTKYKGTQLRKIGARPGIKDWLLRLAYTKMEQHGGDGQAIPYVKAYDAICRLCPVADEDPSILDEHVPLESSYLWSPSITSFPSFQGRWESGDEEGATDYMANFFAGEAASKAWKYRKFYFVYQRPGLETLAMNSQGEQQIKVEVDPKGFGKKYSHIGVVLPDDKVLKRVKPSA